MREERKSPKINISGSYLSTFTIVQEPTSKGCIETGALVTDPVKGSDWPAVILIRIFYKCQGCLGNILENAAGAGEHCVSDSACHTELEDSSYCLSLFFPADRFLCSSDHLAEHGYPKPPKLTQDRMSNLTMSTTVHFQAQIPKIRHLVVLFGSGTFPYSYHLWLGRERGLREGSDNTEWL